jgi:hypothetical protein
MVGRGVGCREEAAWTKGWQPWVKGIDSGSKSERPYSCSHDKKNLVAGNRIGEAAQVEAHPITVVNYTSEV